MTRILHYGIEDVDCPAGQWIEINVFLPEDEPDWASPGWCGASVKIMFRRVESVPDGLDTSLEWLHIDHQEMFVILNPYVYGFEEVVHQFWNVLATVGRFGEEFAIVETLKVA